MKRVIGVALLAMCAGWVFTANAGRAEEVEYELYDANGYLKGSITYFCEGGKYQEGSLEVAPGDSWVSGYKSSCSTGQYSICSASILEGDDWFDAINRCVWHPL